ncbi:MAG: hypothetical protein H7293_09175 [Candidatus Saccharibacteria bacterium]|nr:hypothetical protein [Rhodoferax sp.]
MSIALHDGRPFFEKALTYGMAHGLLGPDKLDAILADAPKGMVQIARYFGTEFLRPELERARERMVNLVSLYLESSCNGDVQRAAESLRDNSFLSRSKGGSDMLKALIAMPQNSHFGMNERSGFTDDQIPVLAKWTLRTLPEYEAELALRSRVATVVDAAVWLANEMGVDADALEEAGKDAEAVIRTALLVHTAKRTELPDWPEFEKMISVLRKKHDVGGKPINLVIAKNLPAEFREVVDLMRHSIELDLVKILDATLPVRKLFDQTPAFMGRYFWLEDALAEIDHFERTVSATWAKVTGGHSDDSTLLTLFLTVAAGSTPKTLLTEKSAVTLVRKIRKSGLKAEAAKAYIAEHAPLPNQDDYTQLWDNFVEDALGTLQSDMDYALNDALALLRRECNIAT